MVEFVKNHLFLYGLEIFSFIPASFWYYRFRKRLRLDLLSFALILAVPAVVTLVSSMALATIEDGHFGGMRIYGAIFIVPLVYLCGARWLKTSVADVCDICTIPLVALFLFAKVNCFYAGCCYGIWINHSGLRFPTREAEMIFYLGFMVLEIPRILKEESNGDVYPMFMISYGIYRAIAECFTYTSATNSLFHVAHVWSLISIGIGTSIYIELKRQRHLRTKRKAPKGD